MSLSSHQASSALWRPWLWALPVLAVVGIVAYFAITSWMEPAIPTLTIEAPPAQAAAQIMRAPDFTGGTDWLNTAKPISIKDLRGKVVLLDFWTLCCINCIHVMPDLAKLEKKYANELVVIGVHSPKFENEKKTESIKKAVLRYEIKHPVVNDADHKIWNSFDVNAWPTIVLIDPEGNLYGKTSGEGNYELLDHHIGKLVEVHKKKKTLNEKPINFELAKEKAGPLFFPGKVLADAAGKRLFIADSTHHRIVITDLNGKQIATAGTGQPAMTDGAFDKASFNDPQGMALKGDTLYVADRKNHTIRALDLKKQTVTTLAGTGQQGQDREFGGAALKTALNSPWDLHLMGDQLYIAMAGHHQIWVLDLTKAQAKPYAGNGRENIRDGQLFRSEFAQPSGLTSDGKNLYVADSEVSAIRTVPLDGKGQVWTVVGRGLFVFGDQDGEGNEVRLQHALGVEWLDGKLYVADTYNSKIKVLDPEKRSAETFLGEKEGTFSEPAGLSYANGKLYVADTNAHRIRVVDMKTKEVTTLALSGVEAPKVK